MAKGSVRKKGKKWYYRFYVEDESGNRIQKELTGTESKAETEALLRKALDEYETQKFVSKAKNITLSDMLDMWMEEELNPSKRSNGTVRSYINTANRVKQHSIAKRKLKTLTAEHLQKFFDSLSTPQQLSNGKKSKGLCAGSLNVYAAVMRGAFRFAVFPKQFITFNPMQYVVIRGNDDDYEMFVDNAENNVSDVIITTEQYSEFVQYLTERKNTALLPIQIAYYTGLRIGETCGLTWQDINLEEQYLTVRRSITYSNIRKGTVIGPTKRKKIRTVDFGNNLAEILRNAKAEQEAEQIEYGELYRKNCYVQRKENNRTYYDVYTMNVSEETPQEYFELDFVCKRHDGAYSKPESVRGMCQTLRKKFDGVEKFGFHKLRHTYTTVLISNGVPAKDVQELLGHSDVKTTLNVYAHGSRESKRKAVDLLDKVRS